MSANRTEPQADGVTVFACVGVWLVFSTALFSFGPYGELAQLSGAPLLEERFDGYDAVALAAQLDQFGARGRALYEHFQVLDGANAILMAVALSQLIGLAVRKIGGGDSWFRALALLPVAAGVLELAENAALVDALRFFPTAGTFADAAGAITRVKLVVGFASLLLAMLGLIALGIAAVVRRVRRA